MISSWLSIVLMLIAFAATTFAYPYVLAFARKHNIVDNPNARKLQRVPVPVMGGSAVSIGFLLAVIVGIAIVPNNNIIVFTILLMVMYAIGVWDDIKDVSAAFRFLVELVVVWMMILFLNVEINDFHGFLGIHGVPDSVSVPLSLVSGVGIMNAINLIDGVDGYCSTYGMMACAIFACVFYTAGDMTMFALSLIGIGALIPFFFHNVFGRASKMFLGDGGSLMLGTLLSYLVFSILTDGSQCDIVFGDTGLSLVALSLAVLAVPVFDTLRVMIFRVIKGHSPFHPDKTHLHHLFIEMGYSHLATSGLIVLGNIVIVGVLLLGWWLGAGATGQTLIVIASALLFTWGFYFFMEGHHRRNDGDGTVLWQRACRRGAKTHLSSTPIWRFLRHLVDSKLLGEGLLKKPVVAAVTKTNKPKLDPRLGEATNNAVKPVSSSESTSSLAEESHPKVGLDSTD
ncbi:MAG: undecaprenyl/decaprenyl-phosphate alpha-N-acetylglucosaminyl 1-phosphate transferase [Bacteroidales bacterium]|nr:undecaprenyl/decaprenyl-phosphate alpha-N-acetylglucosaminyl 1-phosphate transferase [Bacteroidales bacterium]